LKSCLFCGLQIQDSARKCEHCHTFQNPNDEPKRNLDIATLVISTVGVIAVIVTLGAGAFSYFAFQSVAELNKKAESIEKKNQERIDQIVTETTDKLNSLVLLHEHDRFQELFDSVNLDEINAPTKKSIINELSKINSNVSKLKLSTDDAEYKNEINVILRSLLDYKEALDFQSADIFQK
jgi:FlaG/FlaF family flagellin (archaellin)